MSERGPDELNDNINLTFLYMSVIHYACVICTEVKNAQSLTEQ